MTKALFELTESYSDLLIQTLELQNPNELLVKVLMSIDETHTLIDQGLLR